MSKWNHFSLEERIRIGSCLAHGKSAAEIAQELGKSATSISPKLGRYPHVCNSCSKVYSPCGFTKFKYDPKRAELRYVSIKNTTRNHVTFSESELSLLAEHISRCTLNGLSIHQAILSFKTFPISEPTVYSLLKKGALTGLNKSLIQKNKRRKKANPSYV